MGKRKCPSYFGDYKCHVKTNVKDSKGNFVYVDKCLKEAVENLNAVGLRTVASCCGHGIINPKISIEGLSDGKQPLSVQQANELLPHASVSLPDAVDQIEAEKIAIAKREKQGYRFTSKKMEFYRNGFYDAIVWMSNKR